MIEITYDSAVEGLKSLVGEYGSDHVYEPHGMFARCAYVHEGQPDCIVGKFLHAAGVPLERLALADQDTKGHWVSISAAELIRQLSSEGVVRAEWAARNLLDSVQSFQDSGMPWGRVVRYALNGD